jgi:hypothetical protein
MSTTVEQFRTRLLALADDTTRPGWLRAEAEVAVHDVEAGCDIPDAADELTVGGWARAERRLLRGRAWRYRSPCL